MDGYVTDHIEILQDHSALFRALSFFEGDLERRCKMHKRRVDMLEPVCNGTTLTLFLSCCLVNVKLLIKSDFLTLSLFLYRLELPVLPNDPQTDDV